MKTQTVITAIVFGIVASLASAIADPVTNEIGKWLSVKLTETSPRMYSIMSDVPILISDNDDFVKSVKTVAEENLIVLSRKELEKQCTAFKIDWNNIEITASDVTDIDWKKKKPSWYYDPGDKE